MFPVEVRYRPVQTEEAEKDLEKAKELKAASKNEALILDDNQKPIFGKYMKEMQRKIKRNWHPSRRNESKKVVLLFKIAKDGKLLRVKILNSSGDTEEDEAALNALKTSAPFDPLPKGFNGNDIDVQFTFDYNVYYRKARKANDESIKIIDRAIELNPNDFKKYNERGLAKYKLKRYEEAISDYNESIGLNPDYAGTYNYRGNAEFHLKEYVDAIKDYDEAIKLNPDYAKAYYNRGNAESALEQKEAAVKDYDEALRLKPDDADSYYNRGQAKSALGKKEEAEKDFAKAKELEANTGKK